MKNYEGITFEFTSPGTPQKNGLVEQGFFTLYYRMRAMMMHMVLHEKLKIRIWPK